VIEIKLPASEDLVRRLKVGDIVYVSGIIFTLRDRAHARLLELFKKGEEPPFNLREGGIYHCGPLVKEKDSKWEVLSAGPTTSMRMEIFEKDVIRAYRTRVIIGKGGMGKGTLKALSEIGAVYLAYPGGAGVLAASSIKEVVNVFWLDLGMPEAVWALKVDKLGPCVVTMDSHMGSLYVK